MMNLRDYSISHLNALLTCSKHCEIPEILMDPKLNDDQIHAIIDAVIAGIDINRIKFFKFNPIRIRLITEACKNGYSDKIDILCSSLYDNDQVKVLIFGLDNALDISIYSDPTIPGKIMKWVAENLLVDPNSTKKVLDSVMKHIDNINAAELLMKAEEDDSDDDDDDDLY